MSSTGSLCLIVCLLHNLLSYWDEDKNNILKWYRAWWYSTHCEAFTMSQLLLSSMCGRLFGCWLRLITWSAPLPWKLAIKACAGRDPWVWDWPPWLWEWPPCPWWQSWPCGTQRTCSRKKGELIVAHRLCLKTFSATIFLLFQQSQRQSCLKDSILFECIFQWNLPSTMAGEETTKALRVNRPLKLPWMPQ